jgi:hypothetical protein
MTYRLAIYLTISVILIHDISLSDVPDHTTLTNLDSSEKVIDCSPLVALMEDEVKRLINVCVILIHDIPLIDVTDHMYHINL